MHHVTGRPGSQRVLDGAQQDPGGETLSQGGWRTRGGRGRQPTCLRGGLPPGVHEAGLVSEAGLHLSHRCPVELVALLVRVEERAAGVTLEPRPVGVEALAALAESSPAAALLSPGLLLGSWSGGGGSPSGGSPGGRSPSGRSPSSRSPSRPLCSCPHESLPAGLPLFRAESGLHLLALLMTYLM